MRAVFLQKFSGQFPFRPIGKRCGCSVALRVFCGVQHHGPALLVGPGQGLREERNSLLFRQAI